MAKLLFTSDKTICHCGWKETINALVAMANGKIKELAVIIR
jgi:hypothetical protein